MSYSSLEALMDGRHGHGRFGGGGAPSSEILPIFLKNATLYARHRAVWPKTPEWPAKDKDVLKLQCISSPATSPAHAYDAKP
jgi:hypothetical protein